jgi:hypothetical protein
MNDGLNTAIDFLSIPLVLAIHSSSTIPIWWVPLEVGLAWERRRLAGLSFNLRHAGSGRSPAAPSTPVARFMTPQFGRLPTSLLPILIAGNI